MVQEKDQLTNKNQAQSSKDIGNRVADIDFWKSELRHETDLLVGETNALTEVIHSLLFTVFFGIMFYEPSSFYSLIQITNKPFIFLSGIFIFSSPKVLET